MITIDNNKYNAEWVHNEFEQTADIINGDNSGRLQGTKSMYLDYVGTFFNHTGKIRRTRECSDVEWYKLFRVLSNPINKHTVILPFDGSTIKTTVYISQVKRKLIRFNVDGAPIWSTEYDVTLTATDSQWLAGNDIEGLT